MGDIVDVNRPFSFFWLIKLIVEDFLLLFGPQDGARTNEREKSAWSWAKLCIINIIRTVKLILFTWLKTHLIHPPFAKNQQAIETQEASNHWAAPSPCGHLFSPILHPDF